MLVVLLTGCCTDGSGAEGCAAGATTACASCAACTSTAGENCAEDTLGTGADVMAADRCTGGDCTAVSEGTLGTLLPAVVEGSVDFLLAAPAGLWMRWCFGETMFEARP